MPPILSNDYVSSISLGYNALRPESLVAPVLFRFNPKTALFSYDIVWLDLDLGTGLEVDQGFWSFNMVHDIEIYVDGFLHPHIGGKATPNTALNRLAIVLHAKNEETQCTRYSEPAHIPVGAAVGAPSPWPSSDRPTPLH